jgi:hypothetical protein
MKINGIEIAQELKGTPLSSLGGYRITPESFCYPFGTEMISTKTDN